MNMLKTLRDFRINRYDPEPVSLDPEVQDYWVSPCWVHAESNSLDRCNYAVIRSRLEEAHVGFRVLSVDHWLHGPVELVIVPPGDTGQQVLDTVAAQLTKYPILDEVALARGAL